MDTRQSLENEVLGWLDESGDTGTTQANVRAALIQAHHQRVTQIDWPFMLWHAPLTFPLVSGQQNYTLHPEYGRPLYFVNRATNEPLREVSFSRLMPEYTEALNKFTLWNRSPVFAHPSSSSPLSLVSTSASDVAVDVVVRGDTPAGIIEELVTLAGTTPVTTTFSYVTILQLSKSGPTQGTVTVTSNSGAITNVSWLPSEFARSYQQIRMLWTPDATDQIEYLFFRNPNPLTYPGSVPDIPYPHSGILVWDTLLLLAAYDGRLDTGRASVWKDNQSRMDLTMRQVFLDGQSIHADTPQVRVIEDD